MSLVVLWLVLALGADCLLVVQLFIVCCVSLNKLVWFAFTILLVGVCSVLVGL